ncbi:TfoX domain protein [Pseudooceanicola batsensis HTCC2597]|uniref:TfoX domain protein n=1 Tax=Pseudooceanicola batsensis (strain ATCC BAA-863 / DSM 15984 / KCTC 12145 / HTCC2597) TaxID=252305 RepID=A3TXC4_PSEBH|nr:TfoX/Sxy family protein [Pseudooceanicola batsensis]EAQ03484.1 TfoX domain protein [Pseudooceanicola batsensis HTCC2597]
MGDPVSSIRNLGPASVAQFARAGIHDAETLRALGADAAYTRLIAAGTRPHFIGYYALVMGLQGRPWNDCQGAEKAALRERFDAIRAAATRTPAGDLPPDLVVFLRDHGLAPRDG